MKLIKLSTDHYIVVDNSEIKEGDYCIDGYGNISQFANLSKFGLGYDKENIKKITHSTEPLGKPMLFTNAFESDLAITTMGLHDTVIENWGCKKLSLSEIKELIGEVDVEQYAWDNPVLSRKDVYTLFNEVFRDKTIEGAYRISASKQIYEFNTKLRELAKQKALEDNKEKKWTDADVIRIVEKSRQTGLTAEYLMLSLQLTEWEVEIVDGKLKLKQ